MDGWNMAYRLNFSHSGEIKMSSFKNLRVYFEEILQGKSLKSKIIYLQKKN